MDFFEAETFIIRRQAMGINPVLPPRGCLCLPGRPTATHRSVGIVEVRFLSALCYSLSVTPKKPSSHLGSWRNPVF